MTDYPRVYAETPGGPIARFADSKLQQSIDAAISGLQSDEKFAVIAGADSHGVIRFAGMARLKSGWSAVGVFEHMPGENGTSLQVGVRKAWK